MDATTGFQLALEIRAKLEELKKTCTGMDDPIASSAPAGRWSPKMILSHLWGAEGAGHLPTFKAILTEETPRIALDPGNPHFSEKRAAMNPADLLAGVEREYRRIADFTEGLSQAQLARKAHVPMLKDSPLGEYPTLGDLIGALGPSHLQFHIDHLREVLELLA